MRGAHKGITEGTEVSQSHHNEMAGRIDPVLKALDSLLEDDKLY